MHTPKKLALILDLERMLPGHVIECIVTGAWNATVMITVPDDNSGYCVSGIDLSLIDHSQIAHLARSLVEEREFLMQPSDFLPVPPLVLFPQDAV